MSESPPYAGLDAILGATRGFFLGSVLFAVNQVRLFELLAEHDGDADALCAAQGWNGDVVRELIEYLTVERLLSAGADGRHRPTALAEAATRFRGYLDLFVGGYGRTAVALTELLSKGPSASTRDLAMVASGSGELAELDAIPLVLDLFAKADSRPQLILDLGCGDAQFLASLVRRIPDCRGIGIDPSPEAIAEARRLLVRLNVENRVTVEVAMTDAYRIPAGVDCVLFAFVLQEILGQLGEQAVVQTLRDLRRQVPGAHVVVIEEAPRTSMSDRDPYATGYYNPYYLVQTLTQQRLLDRDRWRALFRSAGYEVAGEVTGSAPVGKYCAQFGMMLRTTSTGTLAEGDG